MTVETSAETRAAAIRETDFESVSPDEIMRFIEHCGHNCVDHLCKQVGTGHPCVLCPLIPSDRITLRKVEETLDLR